MTIIKTKLQKGFDTYNPVEVHFQDDGAIQLVRDDHYVYLYRDQVAALKKLLSRRG
jgi:hypothetical protein